MASVPYAPVPTVAPDASPTRGLSIATSGAAFGEATAAALGNLGNVIEQSGDRLFRRAIAIQELKNDSEAKDADADYMIQAGQMHAEFNTLKGKAAVDAFPKYMEDLKTVREGIGSRLTNNSARKMYDNSTRGTMGRTIFNGAGHAAGENKRWAAGASSARIEQIQDYSLHNPDDEQAFEGGLRDIEREVRGTQAPIAGWGTDQTNRAVEEAKSTTIASRIVGMSRTKPFIAEELLSMNRDRLMGKDLDRVEKIVQGSLRSNGSRLVADSVGASDPDKPLDKALADGEKEAEKVAPTDPLMKDFVRERIIADRNRIKAVKREKDFDNREVIEGSLVGGAGQGKIPSTLEELLASDPKAQVAWENLDKKDQRKYMGVLARNAKGDSSWTTEGLRKYQQLKGLADEDPEKFMGTDVISEAIPWSARRELVNLQQKKRQNIESDPRVVRGLRELAPMIGAVGLTRERDPEGYYQFRGALQDALDDYQKLNPGKLPNSQELQEIGSRLMQSQSDPDKWNFGFLNRQTELYRMTVPDKDQQAIKDAFIAEKGREPQESEIQRIYILKRYKDLYDKKPPGVQVPRSK